MSDIHDTIGDAREAATGMHQTAIETPVQSTDNADWPTQARKLLDRAISRDALMMGYLDRPCVALKWCPYGDVRKAFPTPDYEYEQNTHENYALACPLTEDCDCPAFYISQSWSWGNVLCSGDREDCLECCDRLRGECPRGEDWHWEVMMERKRAEARALLL